MRNEAGTAVTLVLFILLRAVAAPGMPQGCLVWYEYCKLGNQVPSQIPSQQDGGDGDGSEVPGGEGGRGQGAGGQVWDGGGVESWLRVMMVCML